MTEHTLTDQIVQPTADRSCRSIDCALCCKLPSIDFDEGVKPAGTWCAHCARPPTCDIYETRPDVCRKFYCTWLGDHNWPKELDPISTGCMVMTEYITGHNRVTGEPAGIALVRIHEQRPGAVGNIDHALKVVWVTADCAMAVYTPNGLLRLIGYDKHGERVTFVEVEANLYGNNSNLPIVTAHELQRWGWDWRRLSARCAREVERINSDATSTIDD